MVEPATEKGRAHGRPGTSIGAVARHVGRARARIGSGPARCTELRGCDARSICSVDEAAGTYRKEADIGVRCQSGQVFPLTEGMTGLVVAAATTSGSTCTSLDMAGAPVSLVKLDDEITKLLAAPAEIAVRTF
jgi:hypothetical protein